MTNRLDELFPNLFSEGFRVTSPAGDRYNCIAWAASVWRQWWWPSDGPRNVWPEGIAREETLSAFTEVFQSIGYEVCADGKLEVGFEKVALYSISGSPTHAARQLENGIWTSKLGELEDIEHTLGGLEGATYGIVASFLKRPNAVS